MKKKITKTVTKWIILRRFIQILIVVVIFIMAITSINHENDIFWQLKMGEEIVQKHYFPIKDPFSFTAYGQVWTLEEWIPGSLFYLLFKYFGPLALILLKALVICITFSLILILLNKKKINLYVSFVILMLAAMVNTRGIWGVFPSIFEYLFLVITIFILEYFDKITWKSILGLILLSLIWSNSHGSFFLMAFVLICYILGSLFAKLIKAFNLKYTPAGKVLSKDELKKVSVAIVASLITPFITPNGYWMFIYPFRISFSNFTSYISEYQRYFTIWNWNFNDFVHGFTLILIISIVLIFIFSFKKLNPIHLFLAVIFILLALSAVRHVAIFSLVAIFILIEYVGIWLGEYRGILKRTLLKDLILILFLISFVIFYKTKIVPFGISFIEDTYPKQAAEFINQNHIKGNMFNHYNYGGYLIWKMPKYKVFIDGRLEMYLGEIGKDYQKILQGDQSYEKLLDKYQITFFLNYFTDPINYELINSKNWKLVNVGDGFSVFVKNTPDNQDLIKKYWSENQDNNFKLAFNQYMAEQLNNLGIDRMKKGELLEGIRYFQDALDYKPDFISGKLNLAHGYVEIGWSNEAVDEYDRILKLEPNNFEAKRGLEIAKNLKFMQQKQKL